MAKTSDKHTGDAHVQFKPAKSPGASHWLRRILIAALVLVAGVAALPTLATRTPLRQRVLSWALADLNGDLTVGDASFGWWSPLVVTDAQLSDPTGQLVARVPTIEGDKRLFDLLLSPRHLGRVRVTNPQVNIVLGDNTTNIEQIFDKYLTPSAAPSSGGGGAQMQIEIVEGTIVVNDALARKQSELSQLNVQATIDGGNVGLTDAMITGLARTAEGGGPFQAQLSLREANDAEGHTIPVGRLVLKTQDFPLSLPQVLLRRLQASVQISGSLSSDLQCEWGLDQAGHVRQSGKGQLSFRQLTVFAPKLSDEPLRLAKLDIPCDLSWENSQLRVTRMQAVCDVGKISLQADVADADKLLDMPSTRDFVRHLARGNNELQMQIDLAQLARLMPKTLRIRQDTQLTSGLLDVELATRREQAGNTWLGRIEASRLSAIHDGREVGWDQPLRVAFAARDEQRGLVVDRLQCQSNFVQIEGAGTADAFQVNSTLDLARLGTELGKFVDLSTVRMAGRGAGQLAWQRQADATFQAGGQLKVDGFEMAIVGATPWTEAQLLLTFGARGSLDKEQHLQQVSSAQAKLISGSDQLIATLRSPVAHPSASSDWPMELSVQGRLGTWMRRFTPVVGSLPGLNADGQLQIATQATLSSSAIDVARCDVSVQPLQVTGWGLYIDEPTATARFSGRWDQKAGRLDVREAALETSVATAVSRDARIGFTMASAAETQGELAVDANLHKLFDWLQDPKQPRSWEVSGTFKSRTILGYQAGKTNAAVEASAENVLATPRGSRQWHEPKIKWTLAAEYDQKADALAIRQFELQSDTLAVQLNGQIQDLAAQRLLQIDGRLNYDLAKIQRVLQPYVGNGLQLAGQQSRSFSLAGPLSSPRDVLQAQDPNAWMKPFIGRAELGWDWMNAYGMKLNPGLMTFDLRDGWVRSSPLQAAIGGGKLNLAPVVRVTPGPIELQHGPGIVADHVELSPEICSQAMSYLSPMFAGVTRAQGQISLSLDSCRIPVATPATGDLAGRLTLHSVEIAGGPVMQELSTLLGTASNIQLKRESEMQFRMVNGRIYHQGLELALPNMTLRTQGSVGLDQTVALMVEMPVPQNWLGANPLSSPLRNQLLRVPVGGTLTRPGLDRQELDRQAGEMFRNSATTAVQNGLNRGLDALLGPAASRNAPASR